ncbi:MAG TPA: tetratricopeptide repeat protein [Anaerolineaceae bacterium]|nr:tetratricopeptide repeat protein [Anaerolineaceae bacterium]
MFADISGFTPLTEGLRESLGPRRGAEELTKHLDQVYTALIAEIERYGGSVIEFAGDSIMCWFDDRTSSAPFTMREGGTGDGSARAVTCAFALQEAMQAFKTIPLPNGTLTALTLKVAVASGPARRFVVGDPQIHYVDALAGATVARTSTGEHLSQGGDVLVDEATVNSLADSLTVKEWRTDYDSGERFAVVAAYSKITEPIEVSPVAQLSMEQLRGWLHKSQTDREESFLTEFRPCVALFLRFLGIDYDAEDAKGQLDVFIRGTQTIVERYEGTLLQITIGDKGSYAYINFGALSAHEDNARRAVKAALDIKRSSTLQMQMGLTQGTMRVGAYGGTTRKTFGALGDDVNLAARLMTAAAPDEILVSSHVYKAVESHFSFEPRTPLPIKGKAEPLPVFAVTGERKQRAIRLQEPTYALPMVGRAHELQLINDKLDLTVKGLRQVIGIVAEAGLGKSRLVAEVIRSARRKGFAGYGGACQSDGIHTPYLAWKSIWQAFFDVDPDMPERKLVRWLEGEIEDRAPDRVEAMPLLNAILDLNIPENYFTKNLEPKIRQSALHALLEDCLKSAAEDEPVLIVIEDLHWIDALSHDLLEGLARALSNHAVCFLLAYRPPAMERLQAPRIETLTQFTRVELHELTKAEAESAVRAKLLQLYPARNGALPEGLVDTLMARAQGNPFYLEELLNYLHDRSIDPSDLNRIELPDSLHNLILSRIDQLSEQERTTLRAASIIGRLFRAKWLSGYYPNLGSYPQVKAVLDALDALEITPLVSPEPELAYLFKHIVTHEVTYESLPFATRAKLHERLARYLESADASVDAIAFHYWRSENEEKQHEYLLKAGEAAQKNFANDAALEYYGKLLPLLLDRNEQIEIHLKRGEVLQLTGKYDEAQSDYHTALELAKDDVALKAGAQFALGKLNRLRGNYDIALDLLSQVRTTFDEIEKSSEIARVLIEMGFAYDRRTQFDSARQVLNESVVFARRAGDDASTAQALTNLGVIAWEQADYVSAKSFYEESLKLQRALGNIKDLSFSLHNFGMLEQSKGDFAAARTLFEESLELSSRIGDKSGTGWALNNLGIIALVQGDYPAARSLFEKHLGMRREMGDRHGMSIAFYLLGRWAQSQGDFDAAKSFFEEHMTIAIEMGDQWTLGYSFLNQGLVAYYQHDYDSAQALFEKSLAKMRAANDKSGIANVLFGLGMVSLEEMTPEGIAKARQYFVTSINLRKELGEKFQLTSGLIGIARHAFVTDDPRKAAKLLGSVDTILNPLNITVEPDLLHFYAQTLVAVREQLGETGFQSAWEAGAAMTLEEAVKFALEKGKV